MMKLATLAPISNENNYIARIRQVPVLSAQEEHDLAIRYRDTGDLTAAETLVVSHLRYVAYVAQEYRGYGLPVIDLIQEGALGLMKAVKRFDPTRGFRLVTFAMHWIKSAIHDYIISNWRMVKIATTKAQRKLFFNLRKYKQQSTAWLSHAQAEAVAKDLGVRPSDVIEMEQRLYGQDMSINIDTDEEATMVPLLIAPETNDTTYWKAKPEDAVHHALEKLDPRSRDIVEQRWLTEERTPLKDLAVTYGVSLERIRQIEKAALAQLTVLVSA